MDQRADAFHFYFCLNWRVSFTYLIAALKPRRFL